MLKKPAVAVLFAEYEARVTIKERYMEPMRKYTHVYCGMCPFEDFLNSIGHELPTQRGKEKSGVRRAPAIGMGSSWQSWNTR